MSKENVNLDTQEKKCFVIMPIGKTGTSEQKNSFGLLKSVIKPVLSDANIRCIAPQEISTPGTITNQIIKYIIDSDIVIANLTGLNPNVMYELGIRHTAAKPVITLSEKGTKLPFDIAGQRNIFYEDSFSGLGNAKDSLVNFLKNMSYGTDKDNPVYTATQKIQYDGKNNNLDINKAFNQLSTKVDNLIAENQNYVIPTEVSDFKDHFLKNYSNYSNYSNEKNIIDNLDVKNGNIISKDPPSEDDH